MNSSALSSLDMMGSLDGPSPSNTSEKSSPNKSSSSDLGEKPNHLSSPVTPGTPSTQGASNTPGSRRSYGSDFQGIHSQGAYSGGSSVSQGSSSQSRNSTSYHDELSSSSNLSTREKISEKKLFKVLVVGDYAVGKTSLIRRYCTSEFTNNYRITIGVDFCLKSLTRNKEEIDLQLWDIAGHERFGNMTRVFYRLSIAAIVCFDISRPSTFDNVKKWRDDINEKVELPNGKPIPMILLANKCDLPDIIIDKEKMSKFAKDNGFLGWFETSAKENTNIDKSIDYLVDEILKISKTLEIQSPARGLKNENNFSLVDEMHGERRLDDNVSSYSQSKDGTNTNSSKFSRCCNTG